jgi:hypothetical protein
VAHESRQAGTQTKLVQEIEFELRQWYAGDYDARVCAERILALIEAENGVVEHGEPLDHSH